MLSTGIQRSENLFLYHMETKPVRDGMNLVAKEFVATQNNKDKQGILFLSEMAGAASELSEAIIINPHDKESVVDAIHEALEMPEEEKLRRNLLMQSRVSRYTVIAWSRAVNV